MIVDDFLPQEVYEVLENIACQPMRLMIDDLHIPSNSYNPNKVRLQKESKVYLANVEDIMKIYKPLFRIKLVEAYRELTNIKRVPDTYNVELNFATRTKDYIPDIHFDAYDKIISGVVYFMENELETSGTTLYDCDLNSYYVEPKRNRALLFVAHSGDLKPHAPGYNPFTYRVTLNANLRGPIQDGNFNNEANKKIMEGLRERLSSRPN
jgi:hypothetical protein